MRKSFFWLGNMLLLAACSSPDSIEKEAQLQVLLNQKEFFKLKTNLRAYADNISDERKIYFQAFVENAFNQNEKSIADIETWMTKYGSAIPDSLKVALLQAQGNDYFRSFQYAQAAHTDSDLLNNYAKVLDSSLVKDLKNDLLIRDALYRIPPQEISMTGNDTIRWTRDKIGLTEIPVKRGDSLYPSIFDTGANISSITKTWAAKLGLKMLDVSYEEGSGITGITFKTSMGIADSLYIGNVLVRNAVFQVVPDEIFYFAPIQFSIHVIIGFPIIEQLREIHIYRDGSMIIPYHSTARGLNNLALDRLNPILSVRTGEDTLSFHFDSGATSSDFYSTYYQKYKKKITSEGKRKTIETGGAGGIVLTDVYVMDSLALYVADKKALLKNVSIHINPIGHDDNQKFYGNLGQDLIMQFKEMTLNFQDMYVDFK